MTREPPARATWIGVGRRVLEDEPVGPLSDPGREPIIDASMSERGLHYIADDLSETWLEDWAGAGVAEIEELLGKHAAFYAFLDEDE